MVQPTERCLKYVQETGAELWVDEDGTYFVVYPDVRTAHVHGLDVYGLFEVYDVGMFEVRSRLLGHFPTRGEYEQVRAERYNIKQLSESSRSEEY